MQGLTKDLVNTTIISLRPCVAQAKVHIIHSLSRQVKNLRNRKCSTEKQKEQNERKVTRYVEEIELLKNSSRDSISRYVLITKKSFKDVVKKESKTQKYNMKVRAFVRVSEHSAVKKVIDKFRNEHPDWENGSHLMKLLQSLGKKKKKVKGPDVDGNEDSDVVSGDESENDSEVNSDNNEDVGQDDVADDSDNSDSKDVAVGNDNEDEGQSDQEMDSDDESDKDNEDESSFVASLKQAISNDKGRNKNSKKNVKGSQLKKQIKETSKGEAVIKMLDLSSMNKDGDWSISKKEQSFDNAPSVNKRSSFFMGGQSESEDNDEENDGQSGEESDGDEVEKRIESLRNSNHHSRPEGWKSKSENRDFRRQNYKRDQNGGKRRQFQKDTSAKKPKFNHKFNKNTERKGLERSQDTNDKNSHRNKSCQNGATKDEFHSAKTKSVENKTNFNSDSKVHPSWEAKQKQKPSIQAFQGKKIVFE